MFEELKNSKRTNQKQKKILFTKKNCKTLSNFCHASKINFFNGKMAKTFFVFFFLFVLKRFLMFICF